MSRTVWLTASRQARPSKGLFQAFIPKGQKRLLNGQGINEAGLMLYTG